ncbi:MAG TPA: DUF4032 domain-containing protein [Blastocatellia bacterium]|nr:DUF4032 domain-containing protein [Blastocatellia bacterium]
MPIPYKLEYVIEETLSWESRKGQKELEGLAGVKLPPSEARAALPLIMEHKWYLSERLGRDVGLRVAAIDYFENIRRPRAARRSRNVFGEWIRRAVGPPMSGQRVVQVPGRAERQITSAPGPIF